MKRNGTKVDPAKTIDSTNTQPFVNITIEETDKIVQSDIDGKFQIEVPTELLGKKITLTFSSPSWISQHVTIDTKNKSQIGTPIKIFLTGTTAF